MRMKLVNDNDEVMERSLDYPVSQVYGLERGKKTV